MTALRVTREKVYHCTCAVSSCGHKWDTLKPPLRCAKCKSPYWNQTKRGERKQSAGAKEKR